MPTRSEAWDALGHVYWKKRDIEQAKKCFEGSLEQNDQSKVALRNLSMVYRMLEKSSAGQKKGDQNKLTSEDIKRNYKMSIELASKAVAFDMADS